MQNRRSINFYSFEENEIEEWMKALEPMVILTDLEAEYKLEEQIGKGFYCKVCS